MMTFTNADAAPRKSLVTAWFFVKIVKEDADKGIIRKGDAAARRLADGSFELHTNGKKVMISAADAAAHLVTQRTIATKKPAYLNADESAQVEMGRIWISSN
jgi:hypothetical protein